MQELYDELKVFRDCSIEEFEDIFGDECNTDLPLFANLYKFREQINYWRLVSAESCQYTLPFMLLSNTAYYYHLRHLFPGTFVKFASLPRSMALFFVYYQIRMNKVTIPHVRAHYKVNINHLFDQDQQFLYQNDHFKALIRRINTKYPHLINPDFEIDNSLL